MLHDKRKNFKYEYGMTSTSLTITSLRRSRRARRWPLHLWGGHNEHATDFYTSDMVMTSTSVTFTPPISGVLMTSTPVTFIPLRWSWPALGDLYTSAEVITSTLLIVTPLRRSWRARRWHLHLWGGHGCVRWFIYGFATISGLFVYKQAQSNHMFSMNESNDEKKSSIRTGSIN